MCVDTQHVVGDDFAAVLAAAQSGSEEHFAVLGADGSPALLRYLRVLVPGAAEDIAAETWVSVVRGLPAFIGDEGAWRAWLFTTARRRMLDQARHQRRHPAEPLALDNIATESAIALLARLPEQQANVILLRVVAGLDTEVIAEMLGTSAGAVRVAAHRGLRKLEAMLSRSGVTSQAGV